MALPRSCSNILLNILSILNMWLLYCGESTGGSSFGGTVHLDDGHVLGAGSEVPRAGMHVQGDAFI